MDENVLIINGNDNSDGHYNPYHHAIYPPLWDVVLKIFENDPAFYEFSNAKPVIEETKYDDGSNEISLVFGNRVIEYLFLKLFNIHSINKGEFKTVSFELSDTRRVMNHAITVITFFSRLFSRIIDDQIALCNIFNDLSENYYTSIDVKDTYTFISPLSIDEPRIFIGNNTPAPMDIKEDLIVKIWSKTSKGTRPIYVSFDINNDVKAIYEIIKRKTLPDDFDDGSYISDEEFANFKNPIIDIFEKHI